MKRLHEHASMLGAIALAATAYGRTTQQDPPVEQPPSIHEQLAAEATALRPMVETPVARAFLEAVPALPRIEARVIWYDAASQRALRADRAADVPAETLESSWKRFEWGDRFYYTTWFGTPLAFARPLDLVARHAPLETVAGKRIADFGYGNIGQLRLLASLGAHATGIDVNTRLHELYSFDGDTGPIARTGGEGEPGSIRLVCGQWPASSAIIDEVGRGYDLFISKNTLKRGYIHPEREVDPRMLVQLGVDDRTFVAQLWEMLNPGGVAMIYNISPAPSPPDEPYKPWSDGRCPFDRALLEGQGFEVLAYDADDTAFVRKMAAALGWGAQMDLENDLFAHYTLLRKPHRADERE